MRQKEKCTEKKIVNIINYISAFYLVKSFITSKYNILATSYYYPSERDVTNFSLLNLDLQGCCVTHNSSLRTSWLPVTNFAHFSHIRRIMSHQIWSIVIQSLNNSKKIKNFLFISLNLLTVSIQGKSILIISHILTTINVNYEKNITII